MVLVFVFVAFPVICFDDLESRKTLKGLKKIYVDVFIDNEVYPITTNNIKTDIELKLRREGIVVSEVKEKTTINYDEALLYVEALILKDQYEEFYSYTIMVHLYQYAILPRFSYDKAYYSCTWSVASGGYVGINSANDIRNSVKNLVNSFLNAYLSVNPK